jgi:hypothetical protein
MFTILLFLFPGPCLAPCPPLEWCYSFSVITPSFEFVGLLEALGLISYICIPLGSLPLEVPYALPCYLLNYIFPSPPYISAKSFFLFIGLSSKLTCHISVNHYPSLLLIFTFLLNSVFSYFLLGRSVLTLINPISPPKGVPLGSPEGRRRP